MLYSNNSLCNIFPVFFLIFSIHWKTFHNCWVINTKFFNKFQHWGIGRRGSSSKRVCELSFQNSCSLLLHHLSLKLNLFFLNFTNHSCHILLSTKSFPKASSIIFNINNIHCHICFLSPLFFLHRIREHIIQKSIFYLLCFQKREWQEFLCTPYIFRRLYN